MLAYDLPPYSGCGTGFIARPLAEHVDQIDAVDISAGMIMMAKTLPGGDRPNINWIVGPIETAPLSGLYTLIVAAPSIHWMNWERTLPRFADHLAPQGWLALVEEIHAPIPWDQQVAPMIQNYSMNRGLVLYTMRSLAEELGQRHLFQLHDSYETSLVPFRQPIDSYF